MKSIFTFFFLLTIVSGFSQTTYTWNVNSTVSSWSLASNWTPNRTTPAVNDILVFDGSATPVVIINNTPTQTIGKLLIKNAADVILGLSTPAELTVGSSAIADPDLSVESGSTLKLNSSSSNTLYLTMASGSTALISGNIIFSNSGHRLSSLTAGAIVFANGSSFTTLTGVSDPFGNVLGNVNSVVFQNGSKYINSGGGNPFGLTAPRTVVVFEKGSLFSTRVSGFFAANGRTFGNLEINHTGTSTIQAVTSNFPVMIDTLTVISGTLNYISNSALILSGDLKNNGGILNLNPGSTGCTVLFNGTVNQNVSGLITLTNASTSPVLFAVASSANVNLQTNLNTVDSVNVHGKLYMNTQTITGNGFNMYPDVVMPVTSGSSTLNSHIITAVGNTGNFRIGAQVEIFGGGFTNTVYVTGRTSTTLSLSAYATISGTVTIRPIFNVATLGIGSSSGISSFNFTGNVATNSRSFQIRGHYEYTGSLQQSTGDGLPDSTKQLILNKTQAATVSLSKNIIITDALSLQKGILSTATNFEPTLIDTTKVLSPVNVYGFANEGYDSSFVRGPMKILASSIAAKIAPIGKLTLFAPVRLDKTAPGTVTYSLEYFNQSYSDVSTDTLPLNHVSTVEYWLISANTTGTAVNAKLSLSWRPESRVGNGNAAQDSAALSNLVVAHYINDGAGLKWRIDGADQNPMPKNTNATVNYGMVTTNIPTGMFSPFTLGTKSPYNLLPVKIIVFNASSLSNKIKLNWRVENEESTKSYAIERSTDGIRFSNIANIASRMRANTEYIFNDISPNEGWNYYRLKILDKRNHIFYSKIIRVWLGASPIRVYPVPVEDILFVDLPPASSNSDLEIVNVSGIVIWKKITVESNLKIDVSLFPKGVYYLQIRNNYKLSTNRFVKQ